MATPANENCLADVRCPNCGNTDSFKVIAIVAVIVTDDGADIDPDDSAIEYDAGSRASCPDCGYIGAWGTFDLAEPMP